MSVTVRLPGEQKHNILNECKYRGVNGGVELLRKMSMMTLRNHF